MPKEVLVEVKGLVPTQSGVGIFLGHGDKVIAIFVDHSVAAAITMFMHHLKKPRPLTHDLIGSILAGLGVKAQKIVVNDLKDDTFFARLFLVQENEMGRNLVEVDSRPSDAIAVALQQGCPIYVTRAVWERAEDMSWALKQSHPGPHEPENEDGGTGEEP
ncbi:MAG: bifunctional nuclease family protein [Verrucomicrobia bacterium]|nr:bifunctional nuclease family protein [Verrucomicrobiota bacterium]MBU1910646.1 bifunctional nuclease family protein [Verrucomicrobiota bacterium]